MKLRKRDKGENEGPRDGYGIRDRGITVVNLDGSETSNTDYVSVEIDGEEIGNIVIPPSKRN